LERWRKQPNRRHPPEWKSRRCPIRAWQWQSSSRPGGEQHRRPAANLLRRRESERRLRCSLPAGQCRPHHLLEQIKWSAGEPLCRESRSQLSAQQRQPNLRLPLGWKFRQHEPSKHDLVHRQQGELGRIPRRWQFFRRWRFPHVLRWRLPWWWRWSSLKCSAGALIRCPADGATLNPSPRRGYWKTFDSLISQSLANGAPDLSGLSAR